MTKNCSFYSSLVSYYKFYAYEIGKIFQKWSRWIFQHIPGIYFSAHCQWISQKLTHNKKQHKYSIRQIYQLYQHSLHWRWGFYLLREAWLEQCQVWQAEHISEWGTKVMELMWWGHVNRAILETQTDDVCSSALTHLIQFLMIPLSGRTRAWQVPCRWETDCNKCHTK